MPVTFDPNNVIMQDAKTGEIPKEIVDGIITDVKTGSAYMQLAKAESMTKPEKEFTHMTGVGAYWVDEGEIIQTSKPTFTQVTMRAKKLGVIIPTTKENLQFSVTNFFELMRSEIAEAFYKKFDAAAFADVENPFAWSVLGSATNASHVVTETANKYDDINDAMGFVEDGNFDPNGVASLRKQKRKYRGTKDSSGLPIFNAATSDVPATLLGLPTAFMDNASFASSDLVEVVGDWNQAYYGILNGITYEILTEATLNSVVGEDGNPINLAERDMVALKATMMVGMMIVNDEAFSVVTAD